MFETQEGIRGACGEVEICCEGELKRRKQTGAEVIDQRVHLLYRHIAKVCTAEKPKFGASLPPQLL